MISPQIKSNQSSGPELTSASRYSFMPLDDGASIWTNTQEGAPGEKIQVASAPASVLPEHDGFIYYVGSPRSLETRGATDAERLLSALSRCRFAVAASDELRLQTYGWLVQAGRISDSEPLVFLAEDLSGIISALGRAPVPPAFSAAQGFVHGRASFCETGQLVRSTKVDGKVSAHFVVPEDGLSGVTVACENFSATDRAACCVRITNAEGKELSVTTAELGPKSGRIRITAPFSFFSAPKGGSKLLVEFSSSSESVVDVWESAPGSYPLIDGTPLYLGFERGDDRRLYYLRVLTARAIYMVRTGQWKRFARALARRSGRLGRLFSQ